MNSACLDALPDKLFLVLSVPRSGSHWLIDTLRIHPQLSFHTDYVIHPVLGLSGNRYARDLSTSDEVGIQIQNNQNSVAALARLEPQLSMRQRRILQDREPYCIENFHPQMFGFDSALFIRNLTSLCEVKNVKLAYRVRNPYQCIRSFLDYKARSPNWGGRIAHDQIVQHYRSTFQSLATVAKDFPGLVLDYDAMQHNYTESIQAIFASLWPQRSEREKAIDSNIIAQARGLTAYELRRQVSPRFFSHNPQIDSQDGSPYRQYFEQHANELEQCNAIYAQLTGHGEP